MTKISQLTDIGSGLASGDEFVIRDISDVGTPNKKLTANGFMNYVIDQASGVGFTQIAAGVGPLSRVRATSSGSTGAVVFETALSGSLLDRGRFDSSGRFLVGTSSARGNFRINATNYEAAQQLEAGSQGFQSFVGGSPSPGGPYLMLAHQRSGAVGGNTVLVNGDDMATVSFHGGDGTNLVIGASVSAQVDGIPGTSSMPGRLVLATAASGSSSTTERMRITSAGQVLIGTTLYGSAGTSFTALGTQVLYNNNSSDTGVSLWMLSTRAADTGRQFLYFQANVAVTPTLVFQVLNNGNTQNANGSYTSISDARLKENIVDANSQWNDIKAIKIRNWNFKEETGLETHRQIGPVAQELELICPGLVSETFDRDGDGNNLETATKGVNQSVLYMKAVKALQEAMERIETLEARLTAAGIE